MIFQTKIHLKMCVNWLIQVEENCQKNICKVLVGNNCHNPDRAVTEEEGKKLADEFNMGFFETSPKTNQNVQEVFNFLTHEILKSIEGKPQAGSGGGKLKTAKGKDGKKSCAK